MGLKDSSELRKTTWDTHHRGIARLLLESIMLEAGGTLPAHLLAKRLREVLEQTFLEAGARLDHSVWNHLVTDIGGVNRETSQVVSYGRFSYDPEKRLATTPHKPDPVVLTRIEGDFFRPLIANAPRIVVYSRLAESAWGNDYNVGDYATIKSHISHIRRKIGDRRDKDHSNFIHLIPHQGVGYSFADPEANSGR